MTADLAACSVMVQAACKKVDGEQGPAEHELPVGGAGAVQHDFGCAYRICSRVLIGQVNDFADAGLNDDLV